MADRYLLESGAPDGYLLEDGTGVLLLEPFTPATDTDDWWSGSALNFAAIAVVGAATLLSSNTAIARTFVHQDEVPTPVVVSGGSASALPTQRAQVSPVFHQWYAQDELPAQAASPIVDEVYDWKPPAPIQGLPFNATTQWFAQDEIPTAAVALTVDEQYDWKALVPTSVVRAFGASPEWDDQALSWSLDEQYNWTPGWGTSPAARINAPLLSADEDIVPFVAPASALDGADFTVDVGPAAAANVIVWAEDDQIVPQPTFRPEESEAPAIVVIAPKIQGVLPVFDSDWTPAAPPEDDAAPTLLSVLSKVYGLPAIEDSDWAPVVVVSAPPEETDAPVFTPALVKANVPLLLGVEDEWIQFVAPPIAIDQSDFTVDVGPAPAANVIVWAEDDLIVPQPTFGLEEFEQPVFVPALVKANAPLWFGDDERITFVTPTPTFEDDSWNILRSVPVNLAPYFAMLFQGSTDDGSIVVTEPPPPPTGTHTWLLVKRRTRR